MKAISTLEVQNAKKVFHNFRSSITFTFHVRVTDLRFAQQLLDHLAVVVDEQSGQILFRKVRYAQVDDALHELGGVEAHRQIRQELVDQVAQEHSVWESD